MSDKRFVKRRKGGRSYIIDTLDDDILFSKQSVCNVLNHQDHEIKYWKHRVNSLLWILGQFDKDKVKELLKELEDGENQIQKV